MTEVVPVDPVRPNAADISRAAECLRRGGLVAFPTETVYGLGVHALDTTAVRRLFDVKGRPPTDPLIIHVADIEQAAQLVTALPDVSRALAERFWPGPLTLVMPRAAIVPPEVTAGLGTVAIRVPAHPVARALLMAAQLPVAAPSANLFSRPSPTRASHVVDDLAGRIDMVLDGGPTPVGIESTVLDLSGDIPSVLRPGAISLEALRVVIPSVRISSMAPMGDNVGMASPGLLQKHYSPCAPLTLYRGHADRVRTALRTAAGDAIAVGLRVGVLATNEEVVLWAGLGVCIAELGSERQVEQIAMRLYAALRELDTAQVDVILARDFEQRDGLWAAVHDRLQRAAAQSLSAD